MARDNPKPARTATVEFVQSYLPTPLNWRLRLIGQSVGGYGVLNNTFGGSFGTEEHAEQAGAIWVATGIVPAHQSERAVADHLYDMRRDAAERGAA